MRNLILAITLAISAVQVSLLAQSDWNALRTLPKASRLRIHPDVVVSGFSRTPADGRLLLVRDDEVTILKNGRAVVIPRASIGRIEQKRRDPVWTGVVVGALFGLLARSTYAAEACITHEDPGCTLGMMTAWAGIGAFFDWRVDEKRMSTERRNKRLFCE